MDEKKNEILKKILVEDEVLSDVIEVKGVKVQFKLIDGDGFYKKFVGVENMKDMANLVKLNTNRLALGIYKINDVLFSDLVKEKFKDDIFENRVQFVNKMNANLKTILIGKYLVFEDAAVKIEEKDKKNF